MDNLVNAAIFLVQTCFTVYSVILMVRILSPNLHGEYHNSIAQFILKLTSPLILPIRRIIRYHRRIDIAAVMLLILLELIHWYLYVWLQTGYWLDFSSALILIVGDLLHLLIGLLFWAIVADSIISWISTPHRSFHEVRVILTHLIAPIMSPLRRVLPIARQIDFVPVVALILLKLIDIAIVYRIVELGAEQSMGMN